jgi:hypothetical protein
MNAEPITLTNTGLPFVVLAALGVVIPRALLPRRTRSHRVLMVVLGVSAVGLLVVGLIGAAAMKLWAGADLTGAFAASPLGTFISLGQTSALGLLAWGPFLAFSALSLSQKIEARREEDMRRAEG